MSRIRKLSLLLPAAALLTLGLAPAAAPALAATHPAAATVHKTVTASGAQTLTGTLPDGATYLIEVPANWNGTLFLYSHGYVVPGSPNPATDVGDPLTGAAMLAQGFALAGSSYASTGWAIQQALPDQISTLNIFDHQVGQPKRTIAWGHSLGGIITAGLIQKYPGRFAGALPMCGVLSGGVATWNTALDSEFAFQQLIDPSVQVVNITIPASDPTANLTAATTAATAAQATPQGQARLALSAALGDTPGWFTPLSAEPAATDYAAQEVNQFDWETQVDFPFAFFLRAELEGRAGGNPSWNTGVNYFSDLRKSSDFREVKALYRAAGLSLHADLETLNHAARISADPAAVRYLERNITFNGELGVPVLTMHTIGDGLVVNQNEQAGAASSAARATRRCCARSSCTGPVTARSPRPRRSPQAPLAAVSVSAVTRSDRPGARRSGAATTSRPRRTCSFWLTTRPSPTVCMVSTGTPSSPLKVMFRSR